jgi:hypothetical protein
MDIIDTQGQRFRELLRLKRKLAATIRRSKKVQIRARMEKRKINEELKKIKGRSSVFADMPQKKAEKIVKKQIEAVHPDDLYPKDLEKHFDKFDARDSSENKIVDIGKISDKPLSHSRRRHADSEEESSEIVGSADPDNAFVVASVEEDEVVIDLSES